MGSSSGNTPDLKSSTQILQRAVEMDKLRRYSEALALYGEGLSMLMEASKSTSGDTRKALTSKLKQYMERAEEIQHIVEKEKQVVKLHKQINIADNSEGYSYQKLFGSFLDDKLTRVEIEDPFIRTNHQVNNFIRFCEVLVKGAKNLKSIFLLTSTGKKNSTQQNQNAEEALNELKISLQQRGVELQVSNSETLHDREIRFDNGYVVKIGRGLDYFKPPRNRYSIGNYDLDLRPCHETTVDIYKKKP